MSRESAVICTQQLSQTTPTVVPTCCYSPHSHCRCLSSAPPQGRDLLHTKRLLSFHHVRLFHGWRDRRRKYQSSAVTALSSRHTRRRTTSTSSSTTTTPALARSNRDTGTRTSSMNLVSSSIQALTPWNILYLRVTVRPPSGGPIILSTPGEVDASGKPVVMPDVHCIPM